MQQQEMSECVKPYVALLSDRYKAVLLLCDADGLSAQEVAELLQVPLTTIKMQLHHARQKTQAALQRACEVERDERSLFNGEPKRQRGCGR